MQTNKIQTYLGFCIRARKIVFGAENVETQKKDVYLLMMDEALGKSSQKSVFQAKEKTHAPLLIVKENLLSELLRRPAVKAVAIQDKNLAAAILDAANGDPQFKFYSGGNN